MNANEISPKTSPRLNRIQKVSRLFRYFVLANLVFNVGFWLLLFPSWTLRGFEITLRGLLMSGSVMLMLFWFWKLAQLFRLYERGQIFAAETIRCIKVLGIICLIGWTVSVSARFMPRPEVIPQNPPVGAKSVIVKKQSFNMGLFSFDFGTGIDFGLLFVGASVVLAAWIMDEGRKIQEEQELTV